MRKLLTIVATRALMLFGAGAALADPPEDPPCDAGSAGELNPNCDEDGTFTPGTPGQAGEEEAVGDDVTDDATDDEVVDGEEQAALLFAWLAEQFELSTP